MNFFSLFVQSHYVIYYCLKCFIKHLLSIYWTEANIQVLLSFIPHLSKHGEFNWFHILVLIIGNSSICKLSTSLDIIFVSYIKPKIKMEKQKYRGLTSPLMWTLFMTMRAVPARGFASFAENITLISFVSQPNPILSTGCELHLKEVNTPLT